MHHFHCNNFLSPQPIFIIFGTRTLREICNSLVIIVLWLALFCDECCLCIVNTCETSQRLHCHSVLRALQSNIYFKNCLCDQNDPDLELCLQVHRMIFLHSCVRKSTPPYSTTFEDVLVCDLVLMALLTLLFLSLSTEHVVFFVCYVSLQFLD